MNITLKVQKTVKISNELTSESTPAFRKMTDEVTLGAKRLFVKKMTDKLKLRPKRHFVK